MQGSSSKIYKKSTAFWRHGKHKGILHGILQRAHAQPEKPKPHLYNPKEFFALVRKKRKQWKEQRNHGEATRSGRFELSGLAAPP